jgi:hypothetical protein
MALHMIKLVVGADSVEALQQWRAANQHLDPEWKVRTRQTPKRAGELVEGGSIYRVIKGVVQCRQKILRIETVGEGQAARCHIVVSAEVVRTAPAPRRPFQGWRYLKDDEAPEDLQGGDGGEAIPTELALKLRELGAW